MIWPFAQLADAWRTIRASRLLEAAAPEPPAVPPAGPPVQLADLAEAALAIALGEIGRGEIGGNNLGPDVARYVAPAKPPQNWCGGFIGWCYEQAAHDRGLSLPFKRSLGAKRLARNVGEVGRIFTNWREAEPGDLGVLHRGAHGSWMGHVFMFERLDLERARALTVEGNHGAKVGQYVRLLDDPKVRWAFGASVRR